MGFSSVFRSLQEIFPQVDVRVLKAVAMENCKHADVAVECVLSEVLPYLPSPSESRRTKDDSQHVNHSIVGGEEPVQGVVEGAITGSPSNSGSDIGEDANDTIDTTDTPYVDAKCMNEEFVGSSALSLRAGNGDDLQMSSHGLGNLSLDQPSGHLFLITVPEEILSLEKNQNVSVATDGSHRGSFVGSGSVIREDRFTDCCNNACTFKDLNELVIPDSSTTCGESLQDQTCSDADSLKVENLPATVQLIPSSQESQEEASDAADCGSLSVKIGATISEFEKPDSRSPSESVSAVEVFETEVGHVENGSSSVAVVSQCNQICSIEFLEEIIGEAKNNKRTLFLAMESVINKMKELEFQEEAAEQIKREVAKAGLDILANVEELRQMLQYTKEANDMHAGEVYAEKAILATEVTEIQSRIQNLSDEREKSLAILEEMSQSLEIRLAAAEEERKIDELEKLETEKSARMALAEKELAFKQVFKDAEILKQQEEENSKLRDFLMDRGHVVDILQGEIAVICQDVKSLKEKFDERVPISKSLSSSQTSCILASSSLSIKRLAPDRVTEKIEVSEALEKPSPAPSSVGQVPNSSFEEKTVAGDNKIPMEDGWEFFEFE
ncbi:hypothetical protein NE237_015131 [Protea cynaroides]|uniref:CUE domain-containing protein n=1 Tax=Protea cynaroides TaxID=273540 RepID=A0A9Q0QQS3_9MAGN|nr:hypothetical protein NE237_015131 [Protea cynaroides]